MRVLDPRLKIIYPYLPRKARILEIGTYYWEKAIEEKDLNGDGNKELIVLYESEGINYLLILKQGRRVWFAAHHERLPFKKIIYFKLEGIIDRVTKQIMIGGIKHQQTSEYQLDIFQYSDQRLKSIVGEEIIKFDKIETQVLGTKVQIIVWQHQQLEAYEVKLYRYEDGRIQQGGWDEATYYKTVVGYYKYLIENYPDEPLYVECLEKAQAKTKKNNTVENEKKEEKKSNQLIAEPELYKKMLEFQQMYTEKTKPKEVISTVDAESKKISQDDIDEKDTQNNEETEWGKGIEQEEAVEVMEIMKNEPEKYPSNMKKNNQKTSCRHTKTCKYYCHSKKNK